MLDELIEIRTMAVILPTRQGVDIRRRSVWEPSGHQVIFLQQLGRNLPSQ